MEGVDAEGGPTPVTPAEALDLRVSIESREELNAFERENILEARAWAMAARTLARDDHLSESFICELHHRMLGRVWRWAGRFRTSDRNMGRPVHAIATDVRILIDDARYWLARGTYPAPEAAVRFHHRLVAIHPWVNGNGRHARLMADILACAQGAEIFAWGRSSDLVAPSAVRSRYLSALRAADGGDYSALMTFALGG